MTWANVKYWLDYIAAVTATMLFVFLGPLGWMVLILVWRDIWDDDK